MRLDVVHCFPGDAWCGEDEQDEHHKTVGALQCSAYDCRAGVSSSVDDLAAKLIQRLRCSPDGASFADLV
jgi:hypothetical protein